jgi:acyl-CoA thioesterase YciA
MSEEKPKGELAIRTQAMPADTNPSGDIFGGWVLSQMDIAGGVFASSLARGRTVTVAVDGMTFHRPVLVGDILCCHVQKTKIGKTSIAIKVEAWVSRNFRQFKVTEGTFTYVAIDEDRKPRPVGETVIP